MSEEESDRASRIPPSRRWLPRSAEDVWSTRGQILPSLIQSRSSASLPAPAHYRRPSSIRREWSDVEANSNEESPHQREPTGSNSVGIDNAQSRSMRLIGNNNSRYKWEQYYKSKEELKKMKKPIRKYYERNNFLIAQYLYIDRLLDSPLPHKLIQDYRLPDAAVNIPTTIAEEPSSATTGYGGTSSGAADNTVSSGTASPKVKRTPTAIYKFPENENTPLISEDSQYIMQDVDANEDVNSGDSVVQIAIYINFAANAVLLIGKIFVIILTDSLSVLASLVDAALDFLSTGIVWTTTKLISRQNRYAYPVGRRRLEPIGVLVFSVIMMTSFFQVLLQCLSRLTGSDHSIVELTIPAIVIMSSTIVLKAGCWLWCRLIKNSSVQALAKDCATDIVFNIFSIIFPLVGFYCKLWYLDALGGALLSLYVIVNWSRTSASHIRNLTGAAATADERAVLLYLTMRFAKSIRQIQGLQAYHAGDKLIVEADVVLDDMSLRDSHDLSESLQYCLESVPIVDRAFVHQDYAAWNLPSHMEQQQD
ncbi:MAG: hypothetical protein M1829_000758 [Trizodia sp. TS-e1964]|nr:MAG: hypothetical protein M1829_000758 [Trizodia sp. TS-e1964]